MGKRGRPPKKKVVAKTPSKTEQCYPIVNDDEEAGKKNDILPLPSRRQRRGTRNNRAETDAISTADPQTSLIDTEKESTTAIKVEKNKKKIKLNTSKQKTETSGDSDATEVYVELSSFSLI